MGNKIVILLVSCLVFLVVGCGDDSKDETSYNCGDQNCSDYETCNYGKCILKTGFCNEGSDCESTICNDDHTCKLVEKTCDCNEWELCNDEKECLLKSGMCNQKSDCFSGECRTDTHQCVACIEDHHCEDYQRCNIESNTCQLKAGSCYSSDNCSDDAMPLCNEEIHLCVACIGDSNCDTWKECGADHTCELRSNKCDGDDDCTDPDFSQCLGDDDHTCVKPEVDPCIGVTCQINATCSKGFCVCDSGTEPDENGNCLNVTCTNGESDTRLCGGGDGVWDAVCHDGIWKPTTECFCDTDYHWNDVICVEDIREVVCSNELPENGYWQGNYSGGKIVQLWDTDLRTWRPAADSCGWYCNEGFHEDGDSCLLDGVCNDGVGNTLETATLISEISHNSTYTMCWENDPEDWFKVELKEGEILIVEALFTYSVGDIDLGLYYKDSAGKIKMYTLAGFHKEYNRERLEHIVAPDEAGTYFIEVGNYSFTRQDYTLKVDIFPPNSFVINEVDPEGEWMEVYNNSNRPINIQSWFVDIGSMNSLDGADEFITTPFMLEPKHFYRHQFNDTIDVSSEIEIIKLQLQLTYEEKDSIIDTAEYIDLPAGKSWGRIPDGTGEFMITTPTPDGENQE